MPLRVSVSAVPPPTTLLPGPPPCPPTPPPSFAPLEISGVLFDSLSGVSETDSPNPARRASAVAALRRRHTIELELLAAELRADEEHEGRR
jgi:hypothetical protein